MKTFPLASAARAALRVCIPAVLLAAFTTVAPPPCAAQDPDTTWLMRNRFEDLTGACTPRGWTSEVRNGTVYAHVSNRWVANTPFMSGKGGASNAGEITNDASTSKLGSPHGLSEGDSSTVLFLDLNPNLSSTLWQVYPNGFVRAYSSFSAAQDARFVARDPVTGGAIVSIVDGLMRVPAGGGSATRIAGGGNVPFGDTTASAAQFIDVRGVAIDASGVVYFADHGFHKVHKLRPDGRVVTVAGTGTSGYTGDGFPATGALINQPFGVGLDAAANALYFMQQGNNNLNNTQRALRRVDLATGLISTVAVPALLFPQEVAVSSLGVLGVVQTAVQHVVAGNYVSLTGDPFDYFTDAANQSQLSEFRAYQPSGLAPMSDGGFLFTSSYLVFRVNPAGVVTKVAGTAVPVQMGTRALWFGADDTSAPGEVAGWVRDHGFGNGWSQRIESPTFTYSGITPVTLEFDAVIEIDNNPTLTIGLNNEGIAADARRLDGVWVPLDVIATSQTTDGPMPRVAGRDMFHGRVNVNVPGGPFDRVRVRMQSDYQNSDEDGRQFGTMGGGLIDNLKLTVGTTVVASHDFEDGTTGAWTLSAFNGYYAVGGSIPYYTLDYSPPTTQVGLQTGFDPADPSCVWTFISGTGFVEPGTYARITSPWIATGDSSKSVLIDLSGKLSANWSGYATQIVARVKAPGAGARPTMVAQPFFTFDTGAAQPDPFVPFFSSIGPLNFPNDFNLTEAAPPVDSIQIVINVVDTRANYPVTTTIPPNPGPTKFPYFDDLRIAQVGVDSDHDGVPLRTDQCPTVSAAGEDADGDGCLDATASLHHVETWMLKDRPIRYRISADAMPQVLDNSDLNAIRFAIQAWTEVEGTSLPVAEDPTTAQKNASAFDGINLVTFQDPDFTFAPGVLAVTPTLSLIKQGTWDDQPALPGQILDADMILNPQAPFSTSSHAGQYDLQSVATHEAGHLLGLSHSPVQDATMFFVIQPGTDAASLQADDEAAIAAAYPGATLGTAFGSITGTIRRGANQNPIGGAAVTARLLDAQGDPVGPEISDYSRADGTYALRRLEPGDYGVRVDPIDGSQGGLTVDRINDKVVAIAETNFQPEWYSVPEDSADDPEAKEAVVVGAGGSASAIDIITNVDIVPPVVTSITPADGASSVGIDALVTVAFSEPIAANTIGNAFTLRVQGSGTSIPGSGQLIGGTRFVFAPATPLQFGTTYEVQITTALTDDEGVPLAGNFATTFDTEPQPPLAITNIIPSSAVNGQLITIEGAGFVGDDSLRRVSFFFPPEQAAVLVDASVINATQLVVRVPGGATTGPVQLIFEGGSQGFRTSNGFSLTIVPPPPQAAPIPSGDPVALDFDPLDIALSPNGTRAFAVGSGGFVSVDLAGSRTPVKHSLAAADAIALTPSGGRAALIRTVAGTLDVYNSDPSSGSYGSLIQSVTTSAAPRALALSPTGRRAYVVAGNDHIDEIDIDPASPTAWQILRSRHVLTSSPLRPLIAMDPRGTQLFVADADSGLRVPLTPDSAVAGIAISDGVDGGIAMSPSGLEYVAASYPGSGHFVSLMLDNLGVPAPSPGLQHVGLSARDVAIAHEGQSAFFVDQVLNQLLVVNIVRSDASYRQSVGAVTTGQAPVAITTASLASVIGVANKTGRSLSFYTYGGSGLELLSVIPPVAYPGDAVAVAGSSNQWTAGTQADLGGSLHPTSYTAGTGVAFPVPQIPAQNTLVTLQNPGGQRSYAHAFEVVNPVLSFAPGITGVSPPPSQVTCFSDTGIGVPRKALLSPDGRILAVYGENFMGCHRIELIRASADGGDSIGRVLTTVSLSFGINGMAWTPDSRQLWLGLGSHGGRRIDADPNSQTFGTSLGGTGFLQPGHMATDPLGRWMYVREMFPDSLGPLGTGLIDLTTQAKLGKMTDVDGPMASSPDGHWLVSSVILTTRVLVRDMTDIALPGVLTTDRSASGAGELVALEMTSDGKRAVCTFGNGYVQVVNLDPAAGAIGAELWFGQPLGPGDFNGITHGTTPTSVLVSRGTTLARLDVASVPPAVTSLTLPGRAEVMAASSDGRRLWTGRNLITGPGGGNPGGNATLVDLYTMSDASSLTLVSGSAQQSLVNQVLPTPVRVKVRKADGGAEPGVLVRFTAPPGTSLPQASGSATLDRITNSLGEAEVSWQMGSAAGSFAMTIQVLGTGIAPIQATATATLDDASIEPVIVAFGPVDGATGLSSATPVYVRFNQQMQLASVESRFVLEAGLAQVTGTISTSDGGYTILFTPSAPLPYATECHINVFAGAQDTDGQDLANGGVSSFTVQSPPTLTLTAISPPAGTVGTPVVIQGQGLSATPADNIVLFNGTLGPVLSADPTALQTSVPLAATTGNVTVQVGPTTSNALPFTVLDPNPVPGSVISTIPANQGIRAIQVTPDGSRAYVTNPSLNEVAAINIAGGTVAAHIPVGLTPQGIGILPDGRRAYVANTGSDNVSVIDTDPLSPTYHTVLNTIPVGDQPIGVAIAAQGPKVIVHNVGSNTISVIDADASNATYDQVVTTTSTGSSGKSGGVTTTQDGGLAWVVGANGVVSVNLTTGTATDIATNSAVADLTITPNQTLVLALLENGDLIVIDALPGSNTFNQVVTTTSTGSSGKSGGVSTTQDGTLAYVTDGAGNTVYVFRIGSSTGGAQQASVRPAGAKPASVAPGPAVTLTLVTTLTAGAGASGVDFDPNNKFGVVANSGDGTITVIGVPTSLPPIVVDFLFNPGALNLKSMGKWVKCEITPPDPWLASQIDVSSLLLEGVPVDPTAATSIDGNTLTVRFDRAALTLILPEGDQVPVHLTGTIGGTRLLEGTDVIRVKRAHVTSPHAGMWTQPGSTVQVTWQIPDGTANQSVALIWTGDKGMTWSLITSGQANDGSYSWTTPAGATHDSVKVGVVVVESGDPSGDFEGVLGVSDYFAIASGPLDVEPAPTSIQFSRIAPNPSRGLVSMRFGLPRAARVTLDVFDLQGRRVKRLIDEERPAGWHQSTWKGDNASGTPTGAGVYFVRFRAEDRTIEQRLVRIE